MVCHVSLHSHDRFCNGGNIRRRLAPVATQQGGDTQPPERRPDFGFANRQKERYTVLHQFGHHPARGEGQHEAMRGVSHHTDQQLGHAASDHLLHQIGRGLQARHCRVQLLGALQVEHHSPCLGLVGKAFALQHHGHGKRQIFGLSGHRFEALRRRNRHTVAL